MAGAGLQMNVVSMKNTKYKFFYRNLKLRLSAIPSQPLVFSPFWSSQRRKVITEVKVVVAGVDLLPVHELAGILELGCSVKPIELPTT
jgi:hypothetical protein